MDAAGLAVGVVSLGIEVCKSLIAYYQDWKNYHSDIQELLEFINFLDAILQILDKTLKSSSSPNDVCVIIENCMYAAEGDLDKLKTKIDKIYRTNIVTRSDQVKAITERMLYSFKRSAIAKLLELIRTVLQHLDQAVQVLQLQHLSVLHSIVLSTERKITTMLSYEEQRQIDEAIARLHAQDQSQNHWEARSKHEEGISQWFTVLPQYLEWFGGLVNIFWVHGKPGCCKTILCSTIIEDLRALQLGTGSLSLIRLLLICGS